MPAISPERLRDEAAALEDTFPDPNLFVPALEKLFEFYSDRTIRPGQSGKPAPLAPMYHVPRPVLRVIETALKEAIRSEPDGTLEIANRLWENPYFEFKQFAIRVLSHLPDGYAEQTLECVRRWPGGGIDEVLLEELFAFASGNLDGMLSLINEWLSDGSSETTRIGLLALESSLDSGSIPALPAIFRILSPMLSQQDFREKLRIAAIIRKLAAVSPRETAFFLRQLYINTPHPEIARLIRQNLDQFPDAIRRNLQENLRRN